MRNPVSVRKKNNPISKGKWPRQFAGDQCNHITPSTAKARHPSNCVFRSVAKSMPIVYHQPSAIKTNVPAHTSRLEFIAFRYWLSAGQCAAFTHKNWN